MKYWFFAALLANVVFLLWEFHYGAFDHESPNAAQENEEQQILTVSEANRLTPPDAPASTAPAESLAGLQAQYEALPEDPQTPTTGESALTAAAPAQSDVGAQKTVPAETEEAAHDITVVKKEINAVAESSAPPAITAEKEQTAAPPISKTPETADVSVQAQAQAVPTQQHATNASAESALAPAMPDEKKETEATASSTLPEAAKIPAQAQPVQTEQVAAQTQSSGELAAPPSESVMPQATSPAAEKPAAVPANSEQTQTASTTAAENSADNAPQQPPTVQELPKPEVLKTACYSAGPVENTAAFEALLNHYRPQLKEVEFAATEKRKNNTYLVYHPAAATIEQSIATAEMLRSNYGISDLLVFREGELKGMISLGVFSNEQRAKTAQSQFEAKGVHAEIRPRYPLEVHYSVRMRWNEQQAEAAQQLSNALKKRTTGVRQMVRGCK